ncbi:MAG: SDR family NAD(P)-dependent oxidoreductase [bacterium]|nr:SDR family NAD(P)-dependent oxidoreductase [bacterium]
MNTNQLRVLITGGGSGIGLALARKFFAAGNSVVITGRDQSKLHAARIALEAEQQKDGTIQIFAGDVANPDAIAKMTAAFPEVNVLVNNAGVQHIYDIATISADEFAAKIEQEIRVNLIAPILLSRAFLPQLQRHAKTGPAAIVNVTSGLALAPKASAPTYCASKAGLRSFSQALRYQLDSHSVRVFEVLAPLVDTAMTAGRGSGKISPQQLADEFWRGWIRDRSEMFIGKSKLLYRINRLWPGLANSIMRKM